MPPFLNDCVFLFCETKVKCVQKSCHSFSENDINYKPSMKNVQSFQVIRFLFKKKYFYQEGFAAQVGQTVPPVLQSNLIYTFTAKSEYRQFYLKITNNNNIINNYELQAYLKNFFS